MRRWCWIQGLLAVVGFHLAGLVAVAQTGAPHDVVFVLDLSGSMKKNDTDRLMLQAVSQFIHGLQSQDGVGVVTFGGRASLLRPLSPLGSGNQKEAILAALAGAQYVDALTNMAVGIEMGFYEIKTHARPNSHKSIVFVTDGIMDTGDPQKDQEMKNWLLEKLLPDIHSKDCQIFGIALTDEADFMLLQQISSATGGDYFRAMQAQDLSDAFRRVSEQLIKQSIPPASVSEPPTSIPAAPTQAPTPQPAPVFATAVPSPAAVPVGGDVRISKTQLVLFLILGTGVLLAIAGGLALLLKRSSPQQNAEEAAPVDFDTNSADKPRFTKGKPKLRPSAAKPVSSPLPVIAEPQPPAPIAAQFTATTVMPSMNTPIAELVQESTQKYFPLKSFPARVGRDNRCELPLKEDTISRHHAMLSYDPTLNQFFIEDLGSSNGTFVNDIRVERKKKPIRNGDALRFYKFRFTFVVRGSTQTRVGKLKAIFERDSQDSQSQSKVIKCILHPEADAKYRCRDCGKIGCAKCVPSLEGIPICFQCQNYGDELEGTSIANYPENS